MIIRNLLPKILSLAILWGVVGFIIFYIDPVAVSDLFVKGVYLPLLVAVYLAVAYSFGLLTRSGKVGVVCGGLVALVLLLMILKVFNALVAVAVGGLILALCYFAIYRDSEHR